MLNFISAHWVDILIAVLLAAIFAVIADALSVGSAIRASIRQMRNRQAERSVARIRNRIAQLKLQRDTYALYASSDKALYLNTLRLLLAMLVLGFSGIAVLILREVVGINDPGFLLTALLLFAMAIVIGIYGITLTALDTREKVAALLAKLDSEIHGLKKKLPGVEQFF